MSPERISDPEVQFLIDSAQQRFVHDILSAALGGSHRLLKYNPCRVYQVSRPLSPARGKCAQKQ